MVGILNKFKKKKKSDKKTEEKQPKKDAEVKAEKNDKKPVEDKKKKSLKKKDNESYKILIKPLITEKATDLTTVNQYAFVVSGNANKAQIAQKIEHVYGVKPIKVRTMNFSGKNVRYGRHKGRKKSWKKAIVYLNPEDKIEIYEGV